jgi:hypothetical protein
MGADGVDLLGGEVELTEFTEIDVESVKGVRKGASGVPILLMKGLPDSGNSAAADLQENLPGPGKTAKGSRDCPKCDATFDADHKGNNCPSCGAELPATDSDSDGGGAAGKSLPEWHSPAALLVRLANENPGTDRGDLFKAVAADGTVDEQPDIDGGMQAIALIAKLIGYEADELGAGQLDETCDVSLLCDAASLLKIWLSRERAGAMAASDDAAISGGCVCSCGPGCFCCDGIVMASLASDGVAKADMSTASINDLPDSAFAYIEDGGKKDESGKTTPRSLRHFPVHDKAHAQNALSRAPQSPFGDEAMPKIKAAAKKFGIDTDDSDGASKSVVAEGGTDVQTDGEDTGSLAKAVEGALTKAIGPLVERFDGFDRRLAKVERTPVPGGPVLSAVRGGPRAQGDDDLLAKAAYYREQAALHSDRQTADGYLTLARKAEDEARAAKSAAASG